MDLLSVFLSLVLFQQQAPAASITLSVSYGDKVVRMATEDLAKLSQVKATVRSHNVEGVYEGPLLRDVLASLGAPAGEALRGPTLRLVVAIDAADGYRAVFSLPELDHGFRDRQIILAIRRNNQPLESTDGPYRIVVPDEARPARWVRQVTGIKVIDVKP